MSEDGHMYVVAQRIKANKTKTRPRAYLLPGGFLCADISFDPSPCFYDLHHESIINSLKAFCLQ